MNNHIGDGLSAEAQFQAGLSASLGQQQAIQALSGEDTPGPTLKQARTRYPARYEFLPVELGATETKQVSRSAEFGRNAYIARIGLFTCSANAATVALTNVLGTQETIVLTVASGAAQWIDLNRDYRDFEVTLATSGNAGKCIVVFDLRTRTPDDWSAP